LSGTPALSGVRVVVDPASMTAILSGAVPESSLRRRADRQLASLWWLSSVDNDLTTPTLPPGRLVRLGQPAGKSTHRTVLGRGFTTIPITVRWADQLPVSGSDWWVNVEGSTGGSWSYRLKPEDVGGRRPLSVVVDRSRIGPGGHVTVYLSLGSPGPGRAVSEPVRLRLTAT
jgi:hypothetical protein